MDERKRAEEVAAILATRYGCIHDTSTLADHLLIYGAMRVTEELERCQNICRDYARENGAMDALCCANLIGKENV